MGEQGGWNLYLNEVLNKTGIITFDKGVITHITIRNRRNHWESVILGGIPIVMTS